MKDKKLVAILIGPPGAGKGTQAGLLAEKFNLAYPETSKIGEERIKSAKKGEYVKVGGKKYYFEKQKQLWLRGELWDPPFITYLMKDKIKELFNLGKSLVLAGSPRTLYETQNLMPLLEKLYGKKNIKIILIEVSAKESIYRNSHRRICELFRHPILYNKETKNLKTCPLDGSKLLKRKGLDDPKTIKIRLEQYKNRTFPIIKFLKEKRFIVRHINGQGSVADVFKRVLNSIR